MSYSFSAEGASKTDAILDAEAKFDKTVEQMPVHGLDKGVVLDHMRSCVNLVREPQEDEKVRVNLSGYISVGDPAGDKPGVHTINATCGVSVGKF